MAITRRRFLGGGSSVVASAGVLASACATAPSFKTKPIAASGGRVLCLPLHPFVIGMPFRINYLDKALEYMCSHDGVWRTTSGDIADWYYKNYYKDPGRFEG